MCENLGNAIVVYVIETNEGKIDFALPGVVVSNARSYQSEDY